MDGINNLHSILLEVERTQQEQAALISRLRILLGQIFSLLLPREGVDEATVVLATAEVTHLDHLIDQILTEEERREGGGDQVVPL